MQKIISRRDALSQFSQKLLLSGAILSIWSKPIVKVVVLPAHATTSTCTASNVPGVWRLEIMDYAEPIKVIEFFAGGTTKSPFIHYWEVTDNGTFRMTQDESDWIFIGTFNSTCNNLSGSYLHNIFEPDGEIIHQTGKWHADKRHNSGVNMV
jgi:hypothetical protein